MVKLLVTSTRVFTRSRNQGSLTGSQFLTYVLTLRSNVRKPRRIMYAALKEIKSMKIGVIAMARPSRARRRRSP
jgi:hypothetical protein